MDGTDTTKNPAAFSNADPAAVATEQARFGTEWFIATAYNGATELGVLADLLQPKADWVSPI